MRQSEEEGQGELCCNGCWQACDPKEHTVATRCGHLYCLACCQTILESDDPTCPICQLLIQKKDIKAVHVLSSGVDMKLVLAGQSPRVALEVAHAAIEFYVNQQQLYARYAQEQSKRKIEKTHMQCRKKLQEVHNGYLNAKRKYQEVLAQKAALEDGNRELQEKYNQKAMQDKKLKESFALLQQENDALRQHARGGGGSGLVASLQPAMNVMMGGGNGAGAGRTSRAAILGMDEGMGLRSSTGLALRPVQPDPSPLPSINLGGFGQAFAYDTPENLPSQPAPMRHMRTSGVGGNNGAARGSGGGHLGGLGGGLSNQLNMGGMGRQALQNDKRQSLGMAFPGPNNSIGTMATM